MAFRTEKNGEDTDIVIDGFEGGIGSSPHKGIANIKNGNISTELGEVSASFVRAQQTLQSTATGTGTLSYLSTDHVNLSIPNSNNLFKGLWIAVTGSSNTAQLPNGTYYVPPSTGAGFKLANYYNTSATAGTPTAQVLVVAGGGGGGSYSGAGAGGGGGGGAGGYAYQPSLPIPQGVSQVVVGAGGLAGTGSSSYRGSQGGPSSFASTTTLGGGGGGANVPGGQQAGTSGGSGGGAGSSQTNGATLSGGTGTASQGTAGGNSVNVVTTFGAGAGGGGSTSAGSDSSATNNGGNGGAGTANSISGASVTYAGGGGGGANTGGTGGTGGAGGGGAGANPSANGTAGTANTGGGGGGSSRGGAGTGYVGGVGGTGVVIISYPTGVVTNPATAGGTYTTSGGRDIFTFSTAGTFSFSPTYANTPAPAANLSGFTAGLTANFTVVKTLGNPIAKATETYFLNGATYYRYYILDNQNLVWVYDSYNDTLYSPTDNVSWFLPDYSTSWCTSATGIAVIDGFLIAAAQTGLYGKPVVSLGGTNTQNTTWTIFSTNYPWNGGASNSPHFCYVGHQGRLYITDGSYVRDVFPDSTLISGGTSDNVQSLSSWIVDTNRNEQGFYVYNVATPISGNQPFTSDDGLLPVVFFTNGSLPTSVNAGQVYYIKRYLSDFAVLSDPTMDPFNNSAVFLAMPVSGAVSGTLTTNWTRPTGYYIMVFAHAGGTELRNVLLTKDSQTALWNSPLTINTTSATVNVLGLLDLSTGAAGTQYFSTFYPTSTGGDATGSTPLYVTTPQRLTLPSFEVAQSMAEIGNTVMVGCKGNVVYPWDQASNLPGTIISLPESNVQSMLTVNQTCYMFAGNQGNVYITDGSLASGVINIPDYVAGIPGSPGTYIESTYTWGDSMYLRGRVYFSLYDQSATKAGNAGGIWSFQPSQNLFIDQDTGSALRLESINSYLTYNGYNPLLIPNQQQTAQQPLYWSAWNSDINTPTYGIDYSTGGTSALAPVIIETDAVPVGTMLNKRTLQQIEYKLGAPLDNGATVTASYRQNLTDAWTACGTFVPDASGLSGYAPVNFEKGQWLQLQITLTPITSSAASNTFVRLREIRIR